MSGLSSFSLKRVQKLNATQINPNGEFVTYWMQYFKRTQFNFALEYAVQLANELNKPLLILEYLSSTYSWACDRFHLYQLQGMLEHQRLSESQNWNYYGYAETAPKMGKNLIPTIAKKTCAIITDDFPLRETRTRNEKLAQLVTIPFYSVDSNGIIPFFLTEKAPYTAFLFRKIIQKNFLTAFENSPQENPLQQLKNKSNIHFDDVFTKEFPSVKLLEGKELEFISTLPIEHSVRPISEDGTRKSALEQFDTFLNQKLWNYQLDRNHPDKLGASCMSGFLHFGKISEHEMVQRVIAQQNANWDEKNIVYENGQSGNFFKTNPSIESFLDELITWRGVGFHFAHHQKKYDEFDSLPIWARQTLIEHEKDSRTYIYTLEEFENSKTHDKIWNAAQLELVSEGRIHNYLRMLWGKKILEWTPNPRKALEIMIELNNKYAIDGCDPNSYSGIFWILGRFDRAWGERQIFGKIRYMSSDSTVKKIDLKQYLIRFGKGENQAKTLSLFSD